MSTLFHGTGAERYPWWQGVLSWPLGRVVVQVTVGVLAGAAILLRDTSLAKALLVLLLVTGVFLLFLARPLACIYAWIGFALLLPPFPFEVSGIEVRLHLAVVVFALTVVVSCLRIREWHVDDTGLAASCLIFLGLLLVSIPLVFLYSGMGVGVQSLLRWMLLCQGFFLMAWLAWGPLPRQWDPMKLLRWILLASALSGAFAIVDFLQQWEPLVPFAPQYIYLPWGTFRRAQGLFYESSSLGNLSVMMLLLILGLNTGARQQLNPHKSVVWLAVPVLAVSLVLSFSRASFVALVIGILVLVWARRSFRFKIRTAAWSLAILACTTLLVALLVPDIGAHYIERLRFTTLGLVRNPSTMLSGRTEMWSVLITFLIDNPMHLLIGIGYKSLPYTDFLGPRILADNMYLSLLVETGLPGLLAFLWLCWVLLVRGYRLTRKARYPSLVGVGYFLLAFWCAEMVQMLSGDILTYWRVTALYFVILGLSLRWARRLA